MVRRTQTRAPFHRFLSIYSRAQHRNPLFCHPPGRWNARIPAAKAMPVADNFLQKQQKQRADAGHISSQADAAAGWSRR